MITTSPFKDRELYLEMIIKLISMAEFKAGRESLDKKQLRWSRSMLPIEGKCEFVIVKELLYWGINHYIYIYI